MILYKEAIPKRGNFENNLKTKMENETSRVSTKFQLRYSLYAFGRPLILLSEEGWLDWLTKETTKLIRQGVKKDSLRDVASCSY